MKQFLDSIDIDHFENYEEYLSENAIYEISKTKKNIPERFIEKYIEIVDIDSITKNQKLSQYFIEKYQDYFDFELISEHQDLSGLFIENNLEKLNIKKVCRHQKLSEEFMETHFDLLDKDLISRYQKLSDEFMKRHRYELNMLYLCMFNNVKFSNGIHTKDFEETLETLEECEQITWENLCFVYPDEKFIEKYIDKLGSFYILNSRKFKESFLQKHIEKFNMRDILFLQRVSEKFLRKNIDKIERNIKDFTFDIVTRQKISFEFFNQYINYSSDDFIIQDYIKHQDFDVNYAVKKNDRFLNYIYLCVIYQNVGHEYYKKIDSIMTRKINDYLRDNNLAYCKRVKWDNISMVKLDEDVFLKYKDNLNIKNFSMIVNMDVDFIERNYKDIDIEYLFLNKNIKLSLSFIKKRMSEFTKLELSSLYLNYNGDLPMDMIEKAVLNGFSLNKKFYKLLSDEFFIEHFDKCCRISYFINEKQFDEKLMEKHSEKLNWIDIAISQKLSESFIEKHSEKLDWYSISGCQKLSEQFIEKYSDKLDWKIISVRQELSEPFIEKYNDKIDWGCISYSQKLSEPFIEKYSEKLDWYCISYNQELSEQFMEIHSEKIRWNIISKYQRLSEQFIERNIRKFSEIAIRNVLRYQVLSEDFLTRLIFENEIDIYKVLENRLVSKDFIEFHCKDVDKKKISEIRQTIFNEKREYLFLNFKNI